MAQTEKLQVASHPHWPLDSRSIMPNTITVKTKRISRSTSADDYLIMS